MEKNILNKKIKVAIQGFSVFFFLMTLGILQNPLFGQNGDWTAPESADNITNPYKGMKNATLEGKKLYTQYCAICHGKKGKGDGVAGMALKPRPSNFKKDIVQNQTDGAIYWKLTEGKAPMASYKETLTRKQRWQLVNFIRSLN